MIDSNSKQPGNRIPRKLSSTVGVFFLFRTRVNAIIRTLEAMPTILRITCLASFLMGIVILVSTIPRIGRIQINGEALSAAELWSRGYGPFLVICGTAMALAGVGIFRRRGWSRWIVIFLYVIFSPIEIIYLRSHPQPMSDLVWVSNLAPGVIWAAFFHWYLFYKQKKAFA